jgi:enoyl-CoA hydratase
MTVHVEFGHRVAVITLDRPERRNAVDHSTILDLLAAQRAITDAGSERQVGTGEPVRAVVLTGSPPAFSAGADLTGVEEGTFAADLAAVLRGFGELPVPVIAAIDGPALGAGAQLVVAADLRVATPDSIIGVPAARLGLVVDHWTVRRLASEFTPPVARAMLIAAETYSGERLHALGGVHRLGTREDAIAWAVALAELAPLTMHGHKLALERASVEPPADDLFEEARRAAWASADAEEGRGAFFEKRPARFTGE